MPAKYSHVKKRAASARKANNAGHNQHAHSNPHSHAHIHSHRDHRPNPLIDKSISQAMSAVSELERCIARMLLLRYEQDIARLFSTRLFSVSLVHLPTLMMRCIGLCGPGWVAHNADSEDIKDFFRSAIGMDMRQAGERVATKSVLWSYTVLRHFVRTAAQCESRCSSEFFSPPLDRGQALSNGVAICRKRGLHSLHLLPYFPALRAHLDALEAAPSPKFAKPTHLGPLTEGLEALEEACVLKYGSRIGAGGAWDASWRVKVRVGYERLVQTLWRVAHEFDVRGYGLVLREKLTSKWCECGCSTDHLGEVCERTVSEEELESGVRSGKQREWDGRGTANLFSFDDLVLTVHVRRCM